MRGPELLDTARALATRNKKRPRQPDLRRAQSTIYYAMFHALARQCADGLIGVSKNSHSKPAWRQVYRALDHGPAKTACADQKTVSKFPTGIQKFATVFREMQEKRNNADYDPQCTLKRSEVLNDIETADTTIKGFASASAKDKTAFCAFVLFRRRAALPPTINAE